MVDPRTQHVAPGLENKWLVTGIAVESGKEPAFYYLHQDGNWRPTAWVGKSKARGAYFSAHDAAENAFRKVAISVRRHSKYDAEISDLSMARKALADRDSE